MSGEIEDTEKKQDKTLRAHRESARNITGNTKSRRKPRIGDGTVKGVKERKEVKLEMERMKRLKQRRREEQYAKDKKVKKSARED